MVKNSKGGSKSKKIARKHVNAVSNKSIRRIAEDGEMYAIVVNHFGGQCEVVTTDGITRLCILRGKFKGRARRDNNIRKGSWVMIGVREWEVREDGKTKCDLLCVYSDIERDELKQLNDVSFIELDKVNTEMTGVAVDNNVVFKDDNTSDYNTIIAEESEHEQENAIATENSIATENGTKHAKDTSTNNDWLNSNSDDDSTPSANDKYTFDIDEI